MKRFRLLAAASLFALSGAAHAACTTFNQAAIDNPFELAFTPDGTLLAGSQAGDSITAFSSAGAQTNKYSTQSGTSTAAATGPAGLTTLGRYNTLYAAENGQTVYMVSNADGSVVWSLPFIPSSTIASMAVAGNVGYALISQVGIAPYAQRFNAYDGTLIGQPLVVPGLTGRGARLSPDGRTFYMVSESPGVLYAIDARRWQTKAAYPVGTTPRSSILTPDGTQAFTSNFADGTVSQVNLTTGVVRSIAAGASGDQPRRMVVDPSGAFLYVTMQAGKKVVKIQISTDDNVPSTVVSSTTTTGPLYGIAMGADGTIYAAQQGPNAILACTGL